MNLHDYFVHAIAPLQLILRGPSSGPEIRAKEKKTFKTKKRAKIKCYELLDLRCLVRVKKHMP